MTTNESSDQRVPVVVMVHPGALPATSYAPLADALGTEAGLLVLDLERIPAYRKMLLCAGEHDVSVAGLAEFAAGQIGRSDVVGRPWLMAGWSLGGVVAYAATALLDERHLPRHLVLLDSIAPVAEYRHGIHDLTTEVLLAWFTAYLAAKRGGRLDIPAGTLRGLDTDPGLELVLREAIRAGLLWPDSSLAGLRKVFDVYRCGLTRNIDLTAAHHAAPARVPMTLVRPRTGLLDTPDPLGWQRLATELSVARCGGDHYSMLGESSAIAAVLSDRLSGGLRKSPGN